MILPDTARLLEIVSKYTPPALMVGGGVAGLQHIMAAKREQEKAMEETSNKDVLVVEVPGRPKLANGFTGAFDDLGRAISGGADDAGRLADDIFAPPEAIIPPGGPGSTPVSGGAGGGSSGVGGGGAPGAGGGGVTLPSDVAPGWLAKNWKWLTPVAGLPVAAIAKKKYEGRPNSSLADAGIITGVTGLGLLGGYGLINRYLRNRKKKSLEEQVNMAKRDYGTLLGQSLAGPKTASSIEGFPIIHGICATFARGEQKTAGEPSPGMLLLGLPGAVAVLSGIAAHKWVYNRQKELDSMYNTSKPTPPKQIRLVTRPMPGAQQDDEDERMSVGLPAGKVAGLEEVFDFVRKADPMSDPDEEKTELTNPQVAQSRVVKVAPGTIQIATEGQQPVEVEATDPNTNAALNRNKRQLANLVAAFHSTPAAAM